MLLLGLVSILVALWYLLLFEPLALRAERAGNRLQAARGAYQEMRGYHDRAMALRGRTAGATEPAPAAVGQRLSLAADLAAAHGLKDAIRRMTPRADGSFSLWLAVRPFSDLVPWLAALGRKGIRIESMDYDPLARGEQELRLR